MSTARGWVERQPAEVVGFADLTRTEAELRREVLMLRRRVGKLAALLRLALALQHASGFTLARTRLPDGLAKARMLRAVEQARTHLPLRGALRFLGISARRVQAWRRRQRACTLSDRSSCPRTSPQRLTHTEVQAIGDMVTARVYRHVPTGRLAQRLGTVCASPSTWHSLVRRHRWRRPRLRVHPRTPSVGVRASRPDELWHIDATVIRLLDGTRAYLHAVLDNYSRRILAWRVADRSTAANSVAVLLAASGQATSPDGTPDVLADAGVENVNGQVDALVRAGIVRRLLALTECAHSNSLIEAWWRSLKHQWLFLHPLDSVATVHRLVAFYVDEHNRVIPHAAFRGLTPDDALRHRRGSGVRPVVAHGRRTGLAAPGQPCGLLSGVSCARGRSLRNGRARSRGSDPMVHAGGGENSREKVLNVVGTSPARTETSFSGILIPHSLRYPTFRLYPTKYPTKSVDAPG